MTYGGATTATPSGTARTGRRIRPRDISVLVLLALVALLILPPLGMLVYGSLTDTRPGAPPNFTLRIVAEAYSDPVVYGSLLNSLVFAAVTATCVLILGTLLAWIVERTDSPVRKMADLFALAPILMPAVLLVSGWILLLGPRNGLINLIAMDYFGFTQPPFNLFTFSGMVWVAILQELPLAFLWLYPAFRSMNPELEEAGLVSGASMATVLRRITLPILRPALLGAWCIFFIYTLGALSVPILIGIPAKIFLFSTEIYLATSRMPSNLNLASAYSLFFIVATVFGIYAYQRAISDVGRFATITGRGYRPRLIPLGRWRPMITGLGIILLLLVAGLPLFVLIWNAFMPYPQAPSLQSLQLVTLANFPAALEYGPARRAVINSMVLGLAAGFITTALGAFIAWTVVRFRDSRLVPMLDQLATLPIAIPGMIFGVSLLWLALATPLPLYGTLWILLLVYIILHLPYAVRICSAGLSQIHIELEEAGQICGGSWLLIFRRIVLMLMAPSLVGSVLYVTLRAFREYAASIFLVAPGTEVFSVLVLDMWESGNSSILSAYVTMVIGLLASMVLLLYWLGRRTGIKI